MSTNGVKTDKLVLIKEAITACIGLMIIVGMFILLWPLLTRPTPDIANAQAIFSILGGWGGVVLGYYFGRIPAERAATHAEAVASVAEEKRSAAVLSEKTTLIEAQSVITETEEKLKEFKKTIAMLTEGIDEL